MFGTQQHKPVQTVQGDHGRATSIGVQRGEGLAAEYVLDCLCLEAGRCFRYVPDPLSPSGDAPCPEQVTVRGSFSDGTGSRLTVDSCAGHAATLTRCSSTTRGRRPRARAGSTRSVTSSGSAGPRERWVTRSVQRGDQVGRPSAAQTFRIIPARRRTAPAQRVNAPRTRWAAQVRRGNRRGLLRQSGRTRSASEAAHQVPPRLFIPANTSDVVREPAAHHFPQRDDDPPRAARPRHDRLG